MVVVDFFIERNPINSTIQIGTQSNQPGVQIKFIDNGPKIEDHELETLFDYFSANRQSLRFAKIIAEAHYGMVWVRNQESDGIELNIELYSNEKNDNT
jgi:K+-sensing histidine kinase KdpD